MIPVASLNTKLIDDLHARVVGFLQQTPANEIGQNLKAALSASFTRLDLVTREEFDIQAQVLARTREKLAALEARIAALEGGTGAPR